MGLFSGKEPSPKRWAVWEHNGEYWLIGPSGTVQGSSKSKSDAEFCCKRLNHKIDVQIAYNKANG